jgi:hypothetical protein
MRSFTPQRCTSRLLPSSNCGRRRACCYYICPYSRRKKKVSGQSRGRKRERDRRKDIDSSDDESFDQEYSRWSEYARTRAKSKSPQPPKIPLLSGSGKPTLKHSCINSNELQVAKGELEKGKHANY